MLSSQAKGVLFNARSPIRYKYELSDGVQGNWAIMARLVAQMSGAMKVAEETGEVFLFHQKYYCI